MNPEDNAKMDQMKSAMNDAQAHVEDKEDTLYSQASPRGKFTGKALNGLVQAANKLSVLFGITDKYPTFGNETVVSLPTDFVRLLSMFSKAIGDAIDNGILDDGNAIDLAGITDDAGIQALAGRLNMAAASPAFKRSLMPNKAAEKNELTPDIEDEADVLSESTPDTTTDKLFASRM